MSQNAIVTQGSTLSWNGIVVCDMLDLASPESTSPKIDVSDLASTAREYKLGLTDGGEASFNAHLVPDDAGQTALRNAQQNKTLGAVVITLSDGTTISFSAYCSKFSAKGAVDQVWNMSFSLLVSGPATWA